MEKRLIDGIEVQRSSGNVYADLGLQDADKHKIKSGLVIEITKAVRMLGLTQDEAARRIGHRTTEGVRYAAWRLRQPVRTQVDGLLESTRLRHRNQGDARH